MADYTTSVSTVDVLAEVRTGDLTSTLQQRTNSATAVVPLVGLLIYGKSW